MSEFLTPAELTARWKGAITTAGLKMWRYRKKGPPYVKLGAKILYRTSDIVAWEAAGTFVPASLGQSQ